MSGISYESRNTVDVQIFLSWVTELCFRLVPSVSGKINYSSPGYSSEIATSRILMTNLLSCFLQVWNHFDSGSCPGQAIGVKTRLDNGVTGFIPTKFLSDKVVKRPEERVKVDE